MDSGTLGQQLQGYHLEWYSYSPLDFFVLEFVVDWRFCRCGAGILRDDIVMVGIWASLGRS